MLVLPSTRRWPIALVGFAVGVGATLAATAFLDEQDETTEPEDQVVADLATAPLEIRDLIEEVEWVGDLGYGEAVEVAAPLEGTVTASAEPGDVLRRGDVAVRIDEQPVVLFYGAVPSWRDLSEDMEGPDVLQLEANLVALGYDPDGTVTVDDEFSSRTEDMVERWQEDLGLEPTGVVAQGDILVVEGPVSVTTAPRLGDPSRQGEVLGSVSARAVVTDVIAPQLGTVESVIEPGITVEHGSLLYTVDGVEVLALTDFSVPDGIEEADDVERNFVLVAPEQQVSTVSVAVGDVVSIEHPIMTLETQTLSVVVPVGLDAVGDWAVGQDVSVELPDGAAVVGAVTAVGTVAQAAAQGEEPTVDVEIEILELVDDDLPASEVTVTVAGESVLGVLVAPTRALVTLAEGGFALEKVLEDGSTVLVAVETGTFDDGVVEVTSSQLSPTDDVVVPA